MKTGQLDADRNDDVRRWCFRPLLGVIGLLSLAACAAHLPRPTLTQAELAAQRWPGASLETLVRARSLYAAKCSGCHVPYHPRKFGQPHWERTLDKMADRSHLTDNEQEQILQYLVAVSEFPPGQPAGSTP